MREDPVPWSEDPAFEAEFGCKLGEVRELHQGYDLDTIRARALAGVVASGAGAPAVPRRRLSKVVAGGGAVAVVLALLGGLWIAAPADRPAPPAPVPVVAPPPAPVTLSAPAAPAAELPVPTAPVRPILPRAATSAQPPTVIRTVDVPAAAPVPPTGTTGPTEATLLAAENEAFRVARDALAGGEAARALQGFDAYLADWPNPRLRDEADLGRLEALVALSRWTDAETVSATLAARPSLAEKRTHVLAMRAEALAGLGRCREAVETAADVSRQHATAIRRTCVEP